MTLYIGYQILNICLIAFVFYMAYRLYDHLDIYENRAIYLGLVGLSLDITGQFSLSHMSVMESAAVGLRLSLVGRFFFGLGFIAYMAHKFSACHRHIIAAIWAIPLLADFGHSYFFSSDSMYLLNARIIKIHGISVIIGTRGPIYFLTTLDATFLCFWGVFYVVRDYVRKKKAGQKTDPGTAVYISMIIFHELSIALYERFFYNVPNYTSLTRVICTSIYFALAIKYSFQNYEAAANKALSEDVGAGFMMISKDFDVLYSIGSAATMLKDMEKNYSGGVEQALRTIVKRKEFQVKKNESTFKLVSNRVYEKGILKGYYIITTDISDIAELEKNAERNSRAKSRLLTDISHEIRTPLNAISGAAEFLEHKDITDDERSKYTEIIRLESASLNDALSNLLEASDDSKTAQSFFAVFDLSLVLGEAVEICSERAAKKNINFNVHIDPDLPISPIGDAKRLKQALINIISNAVRYTDEGNVTLNVSGEYLGEREYQYEFVITDVGAGIFSAEDYSRFVAAPEDEENFNSFSGYELSLRVVKKLIADIGGTIEAKALDDNGSVFRIVLTQELDNDTTVRSYFFDDKMTVTVYEENHERVKDVRNLCGEYGIRFEEISSTSSLGQMAEDGRVHVLLHNHEKYGKRLANSKKAQGYLRVGVTNFTKVPAKGENDEMLITLPISVLSLIGILTYCDRINPEVTETFTAPTAKVLVVDDNSLNLQLTENMMGQFDIVPECVSSGYECLEKLDEGRTYDIIFMDYMMKGMDGLETTAHIRARGGEFASIPIVGFTANSVPGVRDKYIAGGMNDVIFKPASTSDIEKALKVYLPLDKMAFEEVVREKYAPSVSFPEIEDVDQETAERCMGNNLKMYMDMLVSFAGDIDKRTGIMEECLKSKDLKGLEIQAHAIKGISRTLGMLKLSDRMAKMEDAARERNSDYITANLSDLLSYYRKFNKILLPYVEEDRDRHHAFEVQDPTGKLLLEMHGLLEEFEIDEAEKVFIKVQSTYSDGNLTPLIKKLRESIEQADYYESLENVEKLLATIKDKERAKV